MIRIQRPSQLFQRTNNLARSPHIKEKIWVQEKKVSCSNYTLENTLMALNIQKDSEIGYSSILTATVGKKTIVFLISKMMHGIFSQAANKKFKKDIT